LDRFLSPAWEALRIGRRCASAAGLGLEESVRPKRQFDKLILVRLPKELHRRWALYCKRRKISMSNALRIIMMARVDTELPPKPKGGRA
jgi:hypothetical protein